jgi:ABC-type bacteriocin/lantibiotic exporter with double-glycine peptidase domain
MKNNAPRAFVLALFAVLAACTANYSGGAHVVKPTQLDQTWHRAAATPVVKQHDMRDCGLAALAMVGGAWGRNWTIHELSQHVDVPDKGVKLGALRDLARTRGLEAFAIKGGHADLARELKNGRPVVLGLILPFDRKYNLAHYEVVVAYSPRDGSVITLDPASGKHMRRTKAVLEEEWKRTGYATLVVTGAKELPDARGASGAAGGVSAK